MDNLDKSLLNDSEKKGSIWIFVAFLVLIISVSGVLITHLLPSLNVKKYSNEEISIEYNNSWSLKESSSKKIILYYLNEKNNVIINKINDFTKIEYPINSSIEEKNLYQSFLKSFKKQNKFQILNGTDKFIKIDEGIYYARFDYIKEENSKFKRSYYILINKNYNKILTLVSKCENKKFISFDRKIKEIFKKIKFNENNNTDYEQFIANNSKKYVTYKLAYLIPDCWKLSRNDNYNKLFMFKDNESFLEIKIMSNPNGLDPTNALRAKISDKYIGIIGEESSIINGYEWNKTTTYDYLDIKNQTLHNEIYFTISKDRKYIYIVNAFLSNKTTPQKTKYINETIKYVLESAKIN